MGKVVVEMKNLGASVCVLLLVGHASLFAQRSPSAQRQPAPLSSKLDQAKTYSVPADYGQDGGKIYLTEQDYILFTGAFNYRGYTGNGRGGKSLAITLYPPANDTSYRAIDCNVSATVLPETARFRTAKALFQSYRELYSPENRAKNALNSYHTVDSFVKNGVFTIKSTGQRGPARTIRYNQFFDRGSKVWAISYSCISRSELDVEALTSSRISTNIVS
jgi:hypothetical protein